MRKVITAFILVFLIVSSQQQSAFAYSYGDPNEEKVAEVYKQMLVKLDEDPPNFGDAKSLFETVKKEIDMHMGKEPSEIVLQNIADKDKEATISNMQKILVLNISRRLENVEQSFEDFDKSKKLLAKGFATYKALSPAVQEQDTELDKKLQDDFDSALKSLGNPGLFGVGEQEPNIELFKEKKEEILNSLKEQFQLKSLEVGHFTEGSNAEKELTENDGWTDYSQVKNWLPILILLAAILGIVFYVKRRKR